MNIMASSSSPRAGTGGDSSSVPSKPSSLPRSEASRRSRSRARFLATWKSHPRGSAGTPLKGHVESARTSAPTSGGSTLLSASPARVLDLTHLEAPGAVEMRMALEKLEHLVVAPGLDEPEAADNLLGLGVGTVGDGRLPAVATEDASFANTQLLRVHHAAGFAELLAPVHVLLDGLLHLLRAERARHARAPDDDQIFRHGRPPFVRLKKRRTGTREIDRVVLALPTLPPHPALSPFGGEDQWWLGEVGPDDHAGT